jgi:hypothetical protein
MALADLEPRKASQPRPYATRKWRAPSVEARREHGLRAIEAARKALAARKVRFTQRILGTYFSHRHQVVAVFLHHIRDRSPYPNRKVSG